MKTSPTKRSGANASLLRHRPMAPLAAAIATALILAGAAGAAYAQDSGASCNMVGPACDLSTPVVNGNDGPGAGYHDNGHPGTAGNPGGNITADLEDARTLGSSGSTSPINAVTIGGKGGNGSNSDPAGDIIINLGGGWGAAGQNGGDINLTVGSALSGAATYVNNGPLTSGMTLISLGGDGGDGGIASFNAGQGYNGHPGRGGDGGTVTATIDGSWTSEAGTGLFVTSNGGNGGGGSSSSDAKESDKSPQGVDACGGNPNDLSCTAGNGNTVNVTVNGTVSGANYGAFIASIGGDGGTGGASDDCCDRTGGAGGNAGKGGNVTAKLGSTGIAVASNNGAAFYVASLGGMGGVGGASNSAGAGGIGGDAGTVNVEVDGHVNTSGVANTYGVLAQSLGGVGGNGGHSGAWFNPISGSGNTGGAANTVSITGTGATITTQNVDNDGDNSSGVVAQSIGGGGGVGPDSNGWFAVGGNGGNASNGSTASISLTDTHVATFGFNSGAVISQSIGGGGGKGGDACNAQNDACNGVLVNMTVGGTGGAGGSASDANAAMLGNSYVATINKHSPGLEIQSIGGGGGDGGSAYGKVSSLFYGAAISVGGSGGAGGNGGTVNAARTENNGPASQILTFDSDSYGILGQSIGGGGGNGGAATSKSVVKGGGDYPSQSLAMATGGSGGVAGSGNNVYLQNSGLVGTIGGGSAGIVSQSIGGGGGNAGDASATSSASSSNMSLAVSLAFGGTGGAAGNGGNAEAMNHGLVVTTGESATGMLVQSIGGGGGNGGAGDAKSESSASVNQGDDSAENTPEGKSVAFALGSSGSGGAGGSGANATATNTGAIITLGDAAHGIMAQTIGGGGGNAGGAAASTKGDIAIAPQIGGSGGAGGSTWYTGTVNVTNQGTIATFGADANAIIAQSIGGGGGSGGKAATTLADGKSNKDGSNGSSASVQSTLTAIEQNYASKGGNAIGDYNSMGGAISTINSLLGNASSLSAVADGDTTGDDLDNVAGSSGESSDDNEAKSISLNVAIGGKGGNGGSGGYINVNNSGDLGTIGKMSDAIVAQSVGGGGGKGGAASTATSADYSGSLAIGGSGGGGGNGGEPTVTNSGSVYTMGPLSAGIVAQSIGGGGGIGGASATTVGTASASNGVGDEPGGSNQNLALGVSLGGNGGSGGISEAAIVNNSGAIETRGHDSIGIIAQSIAGGGGIVKTLATNLDNAGGSANASSSKDYAMQFKFGGSNGAAGNSGAAHVTTTAAITTSGANSYGVLAQSIGGGGGVALGGKPDGTTAADFFGSGSKTGSVTGSSNPNDDGVVNVNVGNAITTSGQGAMGVVAQSIGGGGGLAGDTGWSQQFVGMSGATQLHGSGGTADVTVASGGSVYTKGNNTPAIWAQSVGGGGGRITNKNGAFIGTAGGSGQGGAVNVQVDGSVLATGNSSIGVFAQSNGDASSNSPISVTVNSGGKVQVGTPSTPVDNSAGAPASSVIYIDHGGTGANGVVNTVTNNGWVYGYTGPANAIAVYSTGGVTHVFNNAGATMGGDILLTNNGGSGCFSNSGTFNSGNAVTVGPCGVSNSGTIDIQGTKTGTTTISSNYSGDGKLVFDADYAHANSDRLVVNGTANVAGAVEVRPSTLRKQTLPLMTATGGLTVDPLLTATHDKLLFTTRLDHDATTLYATPEAHFSEEASNLGGTSRAVADHLQSRFDRGDAMDDGYNALANVQSAGAYQTALESLSGRALGSIGAFRFQSSRDFVSNLEQGCDADANQADCAWGRVQASSASQKETTDALGYKADTQTIEAGMQHELREGLTLGGAIGYEHNQFRDAGGMGSVDGDGVIGGIGLRYDHGPLELTGTIDGGYSSYDSTRTVAVGDRADQAKAKPDVWNAGVHLQASYTQDFGNSYLKPFAELRGIQVHGDAYTEQGSSPFNLAVRSQSQFSAGGGLGAEWGTTHALTNGTHLGFYINGAVEAGDGNDWTTRARFADETADSSFDVNTNVPSTYGRVGLGMNVYNQKNVDFSVNYSTEFGGGFRSNAGIARLAYHF